MDDIAVNAIAGPNVAGQVPGRVLPLGFGSPRGTIQFGPLGTPVACPGISNPASPFRNSGFRIADVNLEPGSWTIRVYARSTVSGEFVQFADIPVHIGPVAPQGPINFQAAASGHTVTVSWQAPGPGIAYYQVQVATTDGHGAFVFSNLASGIYTVSAALSGFTTAVSDPVTLGSATSAQVDLVLTVAGQGGGAS